MSLIAWTIIGYEVKLKKHKVVTRVDYIYFKRGGSNFVT